MSEWWDAFWFFLPAGIANMSPVLANKIPWLNRWKTPLDFGRSFEGARIFGDNKTWRGVFFGTSVAVLVGLFQYRLLANSSESTLSIIAATAAMGFGALAGDAVESFFKRRRGIAAGESWVPFDQIDFIIGGLIFVYPFVRLSLTQIIMIFVIYLSLHLSISYIGYLTGFKKTPI